MIAAAKLYVTPEEYLARERLADSKSEYYDGEIFAMAGSSPEHSLISMNIGRELSHQLFEKPCRVYNSDLKVRATEATYAYPDVTVVCGEPEFEDTEADVLVNPTVIVEVISPTTEGSDRGGSSSVIVHESHCKSICWWHRIVRTWSGMTVSPEVSGSSRSWMAWTAHSLCPPSAVSWN